MQPSNKFRLDKNIDNLRLEDSMTYDEMTVAKRQKVNKKIGKLASIISEIKQTDTSLTEKEAEDLDFELIELNLDNLYVNRDQIIDQIDLDDKYTSTLEKITELQKQTSTPEEYEADPRRDWRLTAKLLDLKTFHVFMTRQLNESNRDLDNQTDQEMQAILNEQANLMHRIAKTYSEKDILRSKSQATEQDELIHRQAKGELFEQMVVGYLRLDTYNKDTFGETFVRSALAREDNPFYEDGKWPSRGSGNPRRAFDVVIEGAEDTRFIQVKSNSRNEMEYVDGIEVVKADDFEKMAKLLPFYVMRYKALAQNSPNPNLKKFINESDEVFEYTFKDLDSDEKIDDVIIVPTSNRAVFQPNRRAA